jgi:hypothetical protein
MRRFCRSGTYAAPMDSALFGFIGVVAGSLTTGGLGYATEWRTRRNDSLAAGRLVYGALVEVELTVTGAVEHGRFAPGRRFTGQLALWEAQRGALARRLGVFDYQIVQAAFFHVRNYDDVLQLAEQEGDADHGVTRIRADPYYDERINTINEAQTIALDAGSRWRDQRRRDTDVQKLINRPGSDTPSAK